MNKFPIALGIAVVAALIFFYFSGGGDTTIVVDDGIDSPVATTTEQSQEQLTVQPVEPIDPIAKVEIEGSVNSRDGRAVDKATVSFRSKSRSSGTTRTITGDDGKFETLLSPGLYVAQAKAPGYMTSSLELTVLADSVAAPVRFTLDRGLTISGYVKNLENKPVANAQILGFPEGSAKDATLEEQLMSLLKFEEKKDDPPVVATSNGEGYYELTGVEASPYLLRCAAKGYAPSKLRHVDPGTAEANFLLPLGGRLGGVVRSTDGSVVPGAEVKAFEGERKNAGLLVEIMKRTRPPIETSIAGDDGSFTLQALEPDQPYWILVDAAGFQSTEYENVIPTSTGYDIDVELEPGLQLRGIVFSPTGEPLEGATVKINPMGQSEQGFLTGIENDGIQTDENGEFAFDTLKGSDYRLVVMHPFYATHLENRLRPDGGVREVQLEVGGQLKGVVTDAATNAPIAGAVVSVQDISGIDKEGVTDVKGEYVVQGVRIRAVGGRSRTAISVQAQGYSRVNAQQENLTPDSLNDGIDFQLERTGIVRGKCVDLAGQPVAGVRVTIKRVQNGSLPVPTIVGSTVKSAVDGSFEIFGVRPGEGSRAYGVHGEFLESRSDEFEVLPDTIVEGVVVRMQVGGSISGLVIDEQGSPLEGATVAIRDDEVGDVDVRALPYSAKSDEEGKFRIGNVEPNNDATVIVDAPGYLLTEYANIRIQGGVESTGHTFRIQRGAFIAGMVVDSVGEPVQGAKVQAIDTTNGLDKKRDSTDIEGQFRFEELGGDPIDLIVEATGYAKQRLSAVQVNSENTVIRMKQLGKVRGFVVDETGAPVPTFSVSPKIYIQGRPVRRTSAKTFRNGSFSFGGLEPGEYEIVLGSPGYASDRVENVYVGEDSTIDVGTLVLTKGGGIGGVLFDIVTNEPIARATVTLTGGVSQLLPQGFDVGSRVGMKQKTRTQSDENGAFYFEGLSVETVEIRIEHRGYLPEVLEVVAGNTNLQIGMSSGGRIEGRVLNPEGVGKSGIQLLLTGEGNSLRTVTDRKGYFEFSGLLDGSYTVRVADFFQRLPEGQRRRGVKMAESVVVQNGVADFIEFVDQTEGEEEREKPRR